MNPNNAITRVASVTLTEVNPFALALDQFAPIQPVADVAAFLEDVNRKPQPSWQGEECLLITLPKLVQDEVKALCRAVKFVDGIVKDGQSVQRACIEALQLFRKYGWALKTFRAKFDEWVVTQDWTVLVNRAKAPASWRKGNVGLPDKFIDFVSKRFLAARREDAKRQAVLSIQRQWETGRNDFGKDEVIPGYEEGWSKRQTAILPVGWTYPNIMRQIKKRAAFTKSVQAMGHEGTAAARKHLPQVKSDRAKLRFMEVIEFDDVKTDFRVIDTATGQVLDLWLLVARDRATGMLLGFGMRPARVRDDGSQEHLKLRDMKQLVGWLLDTYGLPPYLMVFKIEHGTATLSEGTSRALAELIGADRIAVSYSSMLGGKSPSGYAERRIGNSRGKASLESHNRLMHTIGANLPGQTGPHYGKRPADLAAREKEAVETWKLGQFLPENLRSQIEWNMLTVEQARHHLFRIFAIQNHRTAHAMQGFERIAEWFDGQRWQPQNTVPANMDGVRVRARMESPIERAARLCEGLKFTRVSPEIITTFYEHSTRWERVENDGQILFGYEGKQLTFRHVGTPIAPGTNVLAYYHPDDPRFLHLTDGKGAILGTWLRVALAGDKTATAEAIRYSTAAFNVAKSRADQLGAEEREQLEAMRAHNAELMKFADFTDVTPALPAAAATAKTPVAAAMTGMKAQKKISQQQQSQREESERIAREALSGM